MCAFRDRRAAADAGIEIRIGTIQDIDIITEIELDSSRLFDQAGLRLESVNELELATAERNRWLRCLAAGTVLIADHDGREVGFAAVGERDGHPYLDQLSVRIAFMRQGIGTELLRESVQMARSRGGHALWLTTYSHLSWNRPYYERHGFVVAPEDQYGMEMMRELAFERRVLPAPEQRVAMRKFLE